ncbi:MAG: aspartate kinase [Flavobacteriaceae bacterium]|nr:aspartate kinase [Flavobacteriaceae bacterium]
MIILKFGGTSIGTVENIKKVAKIVVANDEPKIVVLSAMSGVTNTLQKISNLLYLNNYEEAKLEIQILSNKYKSIIHRLFNFETSFNKADVMLTYHSNLLLSILDIDFEEKYEKIILAQGELVSTNLFQLFLEEIGESSNLISAIDFMNININGEPEVQTIENKLLNIISNRLDTKTFITQGFICKNTKGEIDNLKRGGSDYTASIIGAAIDATQIQIWTDIDGMHNNDPRFVDHTVSIDEISFDEAAELAYFGAKILHPQSIIPAKEKNIPVLIKNTFKPEAKGTLIHHNAIPKSIRAVAAKDDITAIKIKSYRMLMAYGFLKKIFEVFDKNQTAIDMITTSEVAVSLTIDNTQNIDKIIRELEGFGSIEIDSKLTIICIAGDLAQNKKGITSSIFNCLKDTPIRMISYGGSNHNLSFLVKTSDKIAVLNLLNDGLFHNLIKKEKSILIS